MHKETLTAALEYAKRGWPIVLLYGITPQGYCACPNGEKCETNMMGKHPVPGCGKEDATKDIQTIIEWFEKHQNISALNIGIVTGKYSGNVVLDVDPRNGGLDSLAELQSTNGPLPVTLMVRTGSGGMHYYFRHPQDVLVRTGIGFLGKGLDIKADRKDGHGVGGYVVAPPSLHRSGSKYEWVDKAAPIMPVPDNLLALLSTVKEKQAVFDESTQVIVEGSRHNFLMSQAGKLRHSGISGEAILDALRKENANKCRPPLPDSEVEAIARDVTGYHSPLHRLDDIGNGKRLVFLFGQRLRHCYQQKCWYIWDGRRWVPDRTGQVYQFAKQTVEAIHEDAANRGGDLGEALRRHAAVSGRVERVNAMVQCARSEESIQVLSSQLDANRTLLNCANGTLDLNTGKLYKHRPEDLLTKITETSYEPDSRSEVWEKFLEDTTDGDKELQEFLQRTAGYCLSGLTTEEYIFFVYGPGGTGKSTYFEALKAVLGDDYCKTANFATFLKTGTSSNPNAPRSDLARLPGARLVTAVETSEGKQFAADILKASTGGDKLVVRDLYSSEFEFHPQYKIWLASNSKPRVREDDSGIWRRLLLIPFYHVVPPERQDKNLKERFRYDPREREAILAWAVQGFQKWREAGINLPARIKEETRAYRTEMDPLNTWLEDRCIIDERYVSPFSLLWEDYNKWLITQPQAVKETRIDNKKAFGLALQSKNFKPDTRNFQGKTQRVYTGLILEG